ITRHLLTTFNAMYLGPDRVAGGDWEPTAVDLNGDSPEPFGFFTFDFAGTHDGDGDGLPSAADLAASGISNFSSVLELAITSEDAIAAAIDTVTAPPDPLVVAAGDNRNLVGDGGAHAGLSSLQSTEF